MKSFFKHIILPLMILTVGTTACNNGKQDSSTAETKPMVAKIMCIPMLVRCTLKCKATRVRNVTYAACPLNTWIMSLWLVTT
ncbi:MAG: hypothetical protein IPN60_09860 [Saprospiraceae bacterium]|nr:hypothetical protein [Candidatus Opimibacter skivensis]